MQHQQRRLLHPACSATSAPQGGGTAQTPPPAPQATSRGRLASSKRLQQLVQLDLEEGWGVQPVQQSPTQAPPAARRKLRAAPTAPAAPDAPHPASPSGPTADDAPSGARPAARRLGRKAVLASNPAAAPPAPHPPKAAPPAQGGKQRSPYVSLQSDVGVMGLALLRKRLERGECERAACT